MKQQKGFFDESDRLARLTELGDSLEILNRVIDWDIFREFLDLNFTKKDKTERGRPPFDRVMMLKILILQRIYNLSDDQMEFQITDRMSFMRFLGLNLCDKVPDAKTIWNFRNELAKAKADEKLFEIFNEKLEKEGIIKHEGVIIDATFVDAPRQRNTRDENKEIKEGKIPESWLRDDPKSKHKLCQKDTDARWTKKRNETHYGYKNHVKADLKSKIITKYTKTSAAVHDSNEFVNLIDKEDKLVYADSGYVGKEKEFSKDLLEKVELIICEKGYKNRPLTDLQKLANKLKSRIRCRVEHIFGYMTNSFHGLTLRCIGKTRAYFNMGFTNVVYNICRYKTLKSL